MKRREFFKRALAPLAAAVGLKPGILPAMSTDTAPGFVNEYFPAPPEAALAMEGDFGHMAWVRFNSARLVWHEKPLPEWDGRAEA